MTAADFGQVIAARHSNNRQPRILAIPHVPPDDRKAPSPSKSRLYRKHAVRWQGISKWAARRHPHWPGLRRIYVQIGVVGIQSLFYTSIDTISESMNARLRDQSRADLSA